MVPPNLEELFHDLLDHLCVIHRSAALELTNPLCPPEHKASLEIVQSAALKAINRLQSYIEDVQD